MNKSIWQWKNIPYITKISIEGAFALGSLIAGLTLTEINSEPISLEFFASPMGIATSFVAAVYFAALAYCSYQQIFANEGEECEQEPQGEMSEVFDLASELQKPEIMQIFANRFQEKTA